MCLVAGLAILCLLAASSCTINRNLTPSGRFYAALKYFNDNVEQYKLAYLGADQATQDKWRQEINPVIRAASKALDTWGDALGTESAEEKETLWLQQKTAFLRALVSTGVVKVRGGE